MPYSLKRKRGRKTTNEQYELYVRLLESDEYFRENAFKLCDNQQMVQNKWVKLVEALNSLSGPKKDVKNWKKTLSNWKSSVRSKAKLIKLKQIQTGNPGPPEVPLSSLEKKLIHLTGDIVVDGMDHLELGIDKFSKFKNDEVLLSRTFKIESDDSDDLNNVAVPEAKLLTDFKKVEEHQKLLETDTQDPISARTRKNFTLHSAPTDNVKTNNNFEKLLININSKLESLVDIQRQRLELEKLRFQLDYPGFTIEK